MTHTIEVLQEDIDNAIAGCDKFTIVKGCIVAQALNRIFEGENFTVGFANGFSNIRKLHLSDNVIRITCLIGPEWKNVKPFTFTATEY